jgi:hypothetical protein
MILPENCLKTYGLKTGVPDKIALQLKRKTAQEKEIQNSK